jgi:LEA14-like dessication related protein
LGKRNTKLPLTEWKYYGLGRTSFGSEDSELPWIAGTVLLRNNNPGNGKRPNIASLSRKVLISSIRQLAPYLIIGPRRIILIGAIAAVALAIIFYPLIVQTPFDPQKVAIQLTGVDLVSGSESEQKLDLRVGLQITNTNEFTLTTSKIAYDLFADGVLVGSDTLSYEDVPVNGRPAFFSNQPVTLSDTLTLQYSDETAPLFDKILNNSTDINWRITGSAAIESGTTLQEKNFSSEL